MIRVTGNNSLLMSSLNTDTDNDTKVVDLLKKSSETEKSSKITGKKSEEYDSVKKSASSLKASAAVLSETGEDSIFAKAEESGDYSDLISLIERFTGDYNSLLESLSDLDTDKSANYSKELKSIISGQSEALQIKAYTSEQMLRLTSMWTVVPTIQQVEHPQNMSRWQI